ncbi:MAG: hypothetical protein WKG07_27010 [Hymenobacter sp.]
MAAGGEFRVDNYLIGAGRIRLVLRSRQAAARPATARRPPRARRCFRATSPATSWNKTRTNVAGYLDLESDITDEAAGAPGRPRPKTTATLAANVSGQAGPRYSILEGLALRGSHWQRLPGSLAQQRYFNNTSTQFVSGRGAASAHREQRQPHRAQRLRRHRPAGLWRGAAAARKVEELRPGPHGHRGASSP